MSNLPKNACAYPFKGAMLMHGLPATPCCRFHDRFLAEADKESINTYDATFADVRETMMRNEWHPGCYKCKADEDAGNTSMRTEADQFFTEFNDVPKLEYLEITVGRLCNLACITCGPEFSTKWDDDTVALKLQSQQFIDKLKQNQELDLDNLNVDLLQDLKYIKVTGGEPFLHRQFLNFVTKLARVGLAEQIHIEIFTNCTWWPAKADYDALLQFKKISINTSIDGIGEINNFLRYPSDWEKVESTLDKWIDMREQFGSHESEKIEIKTATTVNVVNAVYMYEFMNWARFHKNIDVVLQSVYEPHYLSISHWPMWFKNKLQMVIDLQYDIWNQRRGRLVPAWHFMRPLTEVEVDEDYSQAYFAELSRVAKHRGQKLPKNFKKLVYTQTGHLEW